MFGGFLGWYTIYTSWGLLPRNGILPGAKLTLRPSLYWQHYCTTFEQWASAELAAWDKEIRQDGYHVVYFRAT